MNNFFLKRDAQVRCEVLCEKCDTQILFPIGAHDGDVVICTKCGSKFELKNILSVRCHHCYRPISARENDVGSDFKCPVCGGHFELQLSDIDFEDGQMTLAYPDLYRMLSGADLLTQ